MPHHPGHTDHAANGPATHGVGVADICALAAEGARAASNAAPPGPSARMTTGRRLFFAFSALVATFLVGVIPASSGLRKIERALDQMRGCEERVQLALELEGAVRDQYARDAPGGGAEALPGYAESRRRARELEQLLLERVEDPEERGWVQEIQQAMYELERILDERRAAAAPGAGRAPITTAAYPLVSIVEDRVDRFFARQHDATVRLRTEVSSTERSMVRWMLAILLGASLLAMGVGLYIRRSVARPVARLREGAERLAGGDLRTRIDIGSDDEFGALAARFNSMTESLQRNQETLVQAEKLAGVGRLAAGVAHELNNPLSVMLGYLTLHRRRATGRLAKDLQLVEQEALRCKEIVRDLLDLSRPEGVLESARVDLRELCEEVVSGLRESGQLPTAEVSVEGAGTAAGDRCRLRQVLVNLLKNAAEASGSGGSVRVRVASSPTAVEVAVSDSGPGVPPAARARIFEPFFTTKASGTGLGLAVSRAIARAHGGDITLGQGEVGGALFALSVPRDPERSAQHA